MQCDRFRNNSFVTIQLANIKCNVKYVHSTEICNSTRFKRGSRFERVDADDITDDLSTFSTGHEIHLGIASGYTGCPRRNVPDFGRVFLMLKYTDITSIQI